MATITPVSDNTSETSYDAHGRVDFQGGGSCIAGEQGFGAQLA